MSEFVIITDSTTDFPQELVDKLGVVIVPMQYTIDGEERSNYLDSRRQDPAEFYAQIRAGKAASTSAINTSSFIDAFEPYLMNGTDILYIAFSSALSGTCNNAMLASEELSPKYPERKVIVVDSLCASMGEGLLVYLAIKEKEKGRSLQEVYDFVINTRLHICHWFTVDDLNYLKRGGRVSATAALLGTVLGIKPILHVDDLGRLIPMGKARGRRQSLEQLVDKMVQTAQDPENQIVFISHSDAIKDAQIVENQVREKLHVKDFITSYIGPVIGAHTGSGTVSLFFLGSTR